MLTVGVPVELPQTHAAEMNDQIEPLVISVNHEGTIFIQETEVSADQLVPRLMAITQHNPEAKIYVRGDKNLAYGHIMETMGQVAEAGFTKVSLLAELPKSKNDASSPSKRAQPGNSTSCSTGTVTGFIGTFRKTERSRSQKMLAGSSAQ